jgi:hypothetical protein
MTFPLPTFQNLPPAGPRAIRPQFSNQYMDSPSGTPPFSGNPLAPHNGTGSVGSGGSGISLMSPNVANAPVSMANSVGGPGGGAQMPCGDGGPGSHESAQARFMMMQGGGGGGGGGAPGAMQQQASFPPRIFEENMNLLGLWRKLWFMFGSISSS